MMKNKMFTRVLGMTCALIMAVTAIVPVCAKEAGDQANSFRYENGQAAVAGSQFHLQTFIRMHGRRLQESIVVVMVRLFREQ